MSNQMTPTDAVLAMQGSFNEIAQEHDLVKWQSESQFAIQAIQKNKHLARCALHTIQNSIVNVAAVGLTLNPAYGYAYLVPEYNKATEQNECMLRISFQGLIKIAGDSGAIETVKADVIRRNDKFDYRGPYEPPVISIDPFSSDRGDPVGVYCWAVTATGTHIVDTMPWAEVLKIKAAAKTQMVWDKWPEEMAKKAIIKRASKQWPKGDSNLQRAVSVLNEIEGSEPINACAEYKEEFDNLLAENNGFGLCAYMSVLSEDIQADLYNSFEKGQITKNKQLTKELCEHGRLKWAEFMPDVRAYIASDDAESLKSELDGFTKYEKQHLVSHLSKDEYDKLCTLMNQ